MRVHMGCGSVYLDGYLNVDVPTDRTFLATDRPDLIERYVTTEDNYYGRHQDKTIETLSKGPLDQEYVCDRYGSFFFLPYSGRAEEILARHSFEHLSIGEARVALTTMSRSLHQGAVLRLDVPDHDRTLELYSQTRNPFYARCLFGPRRGDYGYHTMSYTRERLKRLCIEHGYHFIQEEPNIHEPLYPAFCLRFVKVSAL